MNTTTRKYPRSLGEAFRGADYAGPIETPRGHVIGYGGHMRPNPRLRLVGLPKPITLDSWRARLMRALRFVFRSQK